MYLSSKNIMELFTVDGYYSPIWDRLYEVKSNDNLVRDSMWLYEGIRNFKLGGTE